MLSFAAIGALAALFTAPAQAVPLHTLTSAGCISDLERAEICGGANGGPNEAQGLNDASGVAVSPDGASVYVASDTDDAIVRFNRASDGTLTAAGCISDVDAAEICGGANGGPNEAQGLNGAKDVEVSPDGTSVYVVSQDDDAIVRFNRAADGTLSAPSCISDVENAETCGGTPGGPNEAQGLNASFGGIAVSPDGASVYVVSVGDKAIVRFNRAPDGTLTPAGGCISDLDDAQLCGGANGGLFETQGLDGAIGVAVSPDGNSVYVGSSNDDAIVRFNRATDGALTAAGCIDDAAGAAICGAGNEAQGLNGASGIAIPDAASVHVAGSFDRAIVSFDRAPDGTLSGATCISDVDDAQTCGGLDGGPNEAEGLDGVFAVAVSLDGLSLYAGSFTDDAVAGFNRTPDGTLVSTGCISDLEGVQTCGGVNGGPNEAQGLEVVNGVAISPDGASVYSAGSFDDAIARFSREVPPVCLGSAASGPFDQSLTVPLDCFDPNGDPLTISLVGSPTNGTLGVVDQASDTVTYVPNTGFSGGDSFLFRATADGKQSPVENASVFIAPAEVITPPPETPVDKLLALLASDRLSGRSGRKLSLSFATSAGGSAEIELKKGNRVLISRQLNFSDDGQHKTSLKLATRSSRGGGGGNAKPLKPGNYTIVLTVTGDDGQVAKDSARLRVRRR